MPTTTLSKNYFSEINFLQPHLPLQKPLKNNSKLFDFGKETSSSLLGNREILLIQNFNQSCQKKANFKSLLHRLENPKKYSITVEEVEHFLDDIEQGRFEQSASEEDLFKATSLLIDYAKRGTQNTQDQKSLENDIEQLFSYQGRNTFFDSLDSTSSQDLPRKLFTKKYGKGKDFFKNIGQFIKKHRKAIIITVVAVVAAAIAIAAAVVIIKAAGAAAIAEGAAASGAGLAGVIGAAQSTEDNQTEEKVESPSQKVSPQAEVPAPSADTSKLAELMKSTAGPNNHLPGNHFDPSSFTYIPKNSEQELFPSQKLNPDSRPFSEAPLLTEKEKIYKYICNSADGIIAKLSAETEKMKIEIEEHRKKYGDAVVHLSQEIKKSGQALAQKVSNKLHQVTQVPDQSLVPTYDQYSNTIHAPALSSAYQVTAGVTKGAIITNIEKAKQTIQSYGNQFTDTLKINATTIGSNWPQLIPVIGGVNKMLSNTEGNRALLQTMVGSVHKIHDFRHPPVSDKPFLSDFDPISGRTSNNLMTDLGIIQTIDNEKFKPYDPSLKAVRSRIKDARGREQAMAECNYFSLESDYLLANLNIQSCASPSQQSKIVSLNRPEFKHAMIMFTPGVGTTAEDLKKNTTAISEMLGGYNVHGVYKPTQGVVKDSAKAHNAVYHYEATEATYLLAENITNYLNADPKNIVYLAGHSYGAAINRNALALVPEEMLSRICVLGVAPAGYVVSTDLKDVQHLASTGDGIHLFDHQGRLAAMTTTTYLDPHPDAPGFDHAFLSPTFDDKLDQYYKNITKEIIDNE